MNHELENSGVEIPDDRARQEALNINTSFAVQAPAGSGKTELLSLRFLKLLAVCKQPEEVLAITFTRKAASEMSNRIIATLGWAEKLSQRETVAAPKAEIENLGRLQRQKFHAAQSVLARDQQLGWRLMQAPGRLRIQTIDSFCSYLAARLPLLSGLGSVPGVSDDIQDCLTEAVAETLSLLEEEKESYQIYSNAIASLMSHLDNDRSRLEQLLIALLHQREHWADLILTPKNSTGTEQKQVTPEGWLQSNTTEWVNEVLCQSDNALGELKIPLFDALKFSAEVLTESNPDAAIAPLAAFDNFPEPCAANLALWQGIAALLTTRQSNVVNWRKAFNKNNGFPVPKDAPSTELRPIYKQRKDQILSLLKELRNIPGLLDSLETLMLLPNNLANSPNDNTILDQINLISPLLLAQLNIAFSRHGKVDYSQISQAALQALGDEDSPTDLALGLDNQISHILVDEFQDTSSTQFRLLEKLTAGWDSSDGRTLFIVGDAMQSCYGFRNANVGLFLQARSKGVGRVQLTPLDLTANFRSQSTVVNWVNTIFSRAFPLQDDISRGAVHYSASSAIHPSEENNSTNQSVASPSKIRSAIFCHPSEQQEYARQCEADEIADYIYHVQQADAATANQAPSSIAVLVRNRSHLSSLLPTLRAAEIAWQATEIDPLAELPVVEDLLTLLRCLLNKADEIAWYALLRAPWCGITLDAIHQLQKVLHSNNEKDGDLSAEETGCPRNLSELILSQDLAASLDNLMPAEHDRSRLLLLGQILQQSYCQLNQNSLAQTLTTTWQLLEGSQLYPKELDLLASTHFFDLLENLETTQSHFDLEVFIRKIQQAHVSAATPVAEDSHLSHTKPVQIMTIHKAKGLEFDHVIICGLNRKPRANENQLLVWHERLNTMGQPRQFLATLAATGNEQSPLYRLIRHEQSKKEKLENARLLYIAVTRAKKSALLTATIACKDGEAAKAGQSTLLHTVWQALLESDAGEQTTELRSVAEQRFSPAEIIEHKHAVDSPSFIYPLRSPVHRLDSNSIQSLHRRNANWLSANSPAETVVDSPAPEAEISDLITRHEQHLLKMVGTLVHRTLETVADSPESKETQLAILESMEAQWHRELSACGATNAQAKTYCQRIARSVAELLNSKECAWIYASSNTHIENEFEINSFYNEKLNTHIIDRTFVDEQGTRWIIDYKSTEIETEDDSLGLHGISARYQPQLQRYRELFLAMGETKVRTGLLLTDSAKWIEC